MGIVLAPGAGALPPLFEITDNDHAGYLCVAIYTLLTLMIILVATRVFTRWYVLKFVKSDDYFLMIATFLGFIQSCLVQLAINHGLGKKRSIVSDSDFVLFQKYQYAAQILLIATITSAKISLSLLIQSLLSDGFGLLAGWSLLGLIIGWGIASIFALAFGCPIPEPWNTSGNCVNLPALRIAIGSINIATDVLLMLFPCVIYWNVHNRVRRSRVVVLFCSRIIVCVATGLQLKYFGRYINSNDPTWASLNSSILDQFMMHFSVICTAIPSLGRLIVELQPEVKAFAITEQHGVRNSDKYALSSFGHRFPRDFAPVFGRGRNPSDAESTTGLREDAIAQDRSMSINQIVDYRVEYSMSPSPNGLPEPVTLRSPPFLT